MNLIITNLMWVVCWCFLFSLIATLIKERWKSIHPVILGFSYVFFMATFAFIYNLLITKIYFGGPSIVLAIQGFIDTGTVASFFAGPIIYFLGRKKDIRFFSGATKLSGLLIFLIVLVGCTQQNIDDSSINKGLSPVEAASNHGGCVVLDRFDRIEVDHLPKRFTNVSDNYFGDDVEIIFWCQLWSVVIIQTKQSKILENINQFNIQADTVNRIVKRDRVDATVFHDYALPKKYVEGQIRIRPQYFVPMSTINDLSNGSSKPVVCEYEKFPRTTFVDDPLGCAVGDVHSFDAAWGHYPFDVNVVCCFDEYCAYLEKDLLVIREGECVCS